MLVNYPEESIQHTLRKAEQLSMDMITLGIGSYVKLQEHVTLT
jgi:hypothetical protein